MAKWFTQMLLIGVAYAIAGRIGQYFAAPPIYATAVWPASGVALVGVLLLGYRVWPGLFLGALVVNSWSSVLEASSAKEVGLALLPAASISAGVTLQALIGAWLIRRYVGFPSDLSRERDILKFFGLGGPLACTIGATVGVRTLLAAGTYPESQAALNWWTWWVGDVIGVVVFAPLTLILFAKPKQVWQGRRLTVAVPLCITLAAVAIAFAFSHVSEQQRARLKFEHRASNVFDNLKENVARYLDMVHSMQSFYASSESVTREEFDVFHGHLLTRRGGTQALGWVPRVPRDQREQYESQARSSGFSDFQFTERAADGSIRPVSDRPEYFPIYFIVPHAGNELAFGFDLGSNEARRNALALARDSGEQVATAPITLVQETERQTSFLVIVPVYTNGSDTTTQQNRRKNLRGFVTGAFRVGEIVGATLTAIGGADFRLSIVDTAAAGNNRALYDSGVDQTRPKSSESLPVLSRKIRWTSDLKVAGRPWKFDFVPSDNFFASDSDNDTWLVLAGGLMFTSLLGVFLMIISGRATQVEELVVDRTHELSETNLELEHEIAERKRFEDALSKTHEDLERRVEERTTDLKASEARYQDLYDHAPDMFVSVDVATQRLIECNHTFLTVTGFKKHEIIGRPIFEIYHDDSLGAARVSMQSFLDTGSNKDVELNLLRKNKEPLAVSLNVSAVRDEHGQLTHSRAVLRDISETKLAEAKIKHHEAELAHVARLSTMGEMAAGLAHEINQPLAAIAAYADGVAVRLRGGGITDDQLNDVVRHIAADAHRAGEVIRRLRRFVRNREPERAPVDINTLVRDVAQFVASDATQRQIRVELDLADNMPTALSDAIEFQQVLLNLVRNGFDAMADTHAEDRLLRILTRSSDRVLEISVEDHGHGLPGSTNEQVFEAFFTSKDEGLGMGLAISRSIVESHGGRIWATPTSGGAVFHFTLPIATEDAMPHIE